MTAPQKWPPAVIANIRAQLDGNTRRDLLQWARRVISRPPSAAELSRAELVMDIEKSEAPTGGLGAKEKTK